MSESPRAGPQPTGEADWRRAYEASLPKDVSREAVTGSGLHLPPLLPLAGDDGRLGWPGQFPFTRGPYASMFRARPWTMRQYGGFGDAAATNARFRFLLARGQTGLSVAFDLPTQMGHDPDAPLAEGEVGKVGVSITCLQDMRVLLREIPLDRVSISMTINSTAAVLLAMLLAVAEEQGVAPAALRGTLQNDLLKEYIARGTFRFPPGPSLRLVTDIIEHCHRELPRFNPISISGYHMREAGCTAPQEIAFTLADGLEYVKHAAARGLPVDEFAGQLSFFFNAHNDLLEEVCKFRAARRLWAALLRERFGATAPEALRLRFHTQTAGSTLTSQQPDVNVVRVTLQALAAVLGGTQSLHTNSRDEALGLPTEEAALLALRTQQVLAEESGITQAIDPLGGAPFIEALTDKLEAEARALLAEIDRRGGALAAVEQGFQQQQIHRAAYEHARAVEAGTRRIVGVNCHVLPGERPAPGLKVDESVRAARIRELSAWRAARDAAACETALGALQAAAGGPGNLVPSIVRAVKAGATVGEICARLQAVFGAYRPAVSL